MMPDEVWGVITDDDIAEARGMVIEYARTRMPPTGAHPRFLALLDQMRDIHIRKARDYGELGPDGTNLLANMKRSLAMGINPATAAMIRMSDKWSRVQTLYARRLRDGSGPAVADESLSDTLVDLASYALLALILMEEEGKE